MKTLVLKFAFFGLLIGYTRGLENLDDISSPVSDDQLDDSSDYDLFDYDDNANTKDIDNKYEDDDEYTIKPPTKRFWNRIWSMYRPHRKPWSPVRKKVDQYRFLMKGLGKRGVETSSRQLDLPETNNNVYPAMPLRSGDSDKPSLDEVEDFVMLTNAYADILDNSKRTPEVYNQKLYPIQDGTQRMEVEMDRKLDSLMDDDAIQSTNDYMDIFLNAHKHNFGDVDQVVSPGRNHDIQFRNGYISDSEKMPFQEVKRDQINQNQKRWWAPNRLKIYGLKTPKSIRERHYRRARIDPVLYLIGLGR